jgi:hypothetical protein
MVRESVLEVPKNEDPQVEKSTQGKTEQNVNNHTTKPVVSVDSPNSTEINTNGNGLTVSLAEPGPHPLTNYMKTILTRQLDLETSIISLKTEISKLQIENKFFTNKLSVCEQIEHSNDFNKLR